MRRLRKDNAEPIEHDGLWATKSQGKHALVTWVGWYNHQRLHSVLDYLPPIEYEQHHHQQTAVRKAS
ncbi:integrase core domain-containing protein [Salinactinospora qingdaonensis]|uniref:integrase core domain-containing protein n=1 Tax=Salinactinospora qingdaonensis TaxID=702744 RepID=UPI003CD061F3